MSTATVAATDASRPMLGAQLDQLSINCIRTLSIDAVQQAKSGHPGTPMALAPLVYTLWNRVMRFDPQDPIWPNRDRFVLSNGHASMLLWSVLHLAGVRAVNADYEHLGQLAVSLDDIRHFRQLGSKAPGHPEYHLVSGVEATTGPLGQGVAMSVGMAMAEKANIRRAAAAAFRMLIVYRNTRLVQQTPRSEYQTRNHAPVRFRPMQALNRLHRRTGNAQHEPPAIPVSGDFIGGVNRDAHFLPFTPHNALIQLKIFPCCFRGIPF